MAHKRQKQEKYIDSILDHCNTLNSLRILGVLIKEKINKMMDIKLRSHKIKFELACLFLLEHRLKIVLPVYINDATEEQKYLLLPNYQRTDIIKYRHLCKFNFSATELKHIKGYRLLTSVGYYHPTLNPNGCVRDHRISIKTGFISKINPKLMSHPANCEFLLNKTNILKSSDNSITMESLLEDVKKWDKLDTNRKSKRRWKEFN